LQIIRPGVLVLLVRTERAHVARRVVDKPVPDHLILTLERPRTPCNRTEMGPVLGMHICMGTGT
jgi:hypothetical protein